MHTPGSLLLALASAAAAASWSKLSCPTPDEVFPSSCTQPSFHTDVAVTLFFQVETRNPHGAAFSCVDAAAPDLVYCVRNVTNPEAGSVGSCFFLLPAGRSYACASPTGGVNSIDADYAPLAAPALTGAAAPLPTCLSGRLAAGAHCTLPGDVSRADAYVFAAFRGAGAGGAQSGLRCEAGGVTVCSWSTSASGTGPFDASSCAFPLGGSSALTCTGTGALGAGAVEFTAPAMALPFSAPYVGSAAAGPACPPPGPKPNDCDCSTANNSTDADLLVSISTMSDEKFESFHCYSEGINVCGWGVNSNMSGAASACTFLLPAGGKYYCSMEWGATTFPATATLQLARSLFKAVPRARAAAVPAAAAPRGRLALDPAQAPRLRAQWAAWQAEHGAAFPAAERERRFAAFAAHVEAAENAISSGRIVGAPHLDAAGRPTRFNKFAATPRAEWAALHRRGTPRALVEGARRAAGGGAPVDLPPPPPPPPALDWREEGIVTPVKDQAQCGSCWSFSTTGSVESAWAYAGNALVSLSEQQLVSCDSTSDGCDGGWPNTAMKWFGAHGADTEASYPYTAGNGDSGKCTTTGHVKSPVNVTGWRLVPGNSSAETEAALEAWLAAYGPVSILVDAMTQLWWPYNGGLMTGCCDTSTDHAVVLVGYNTTGDGIPYWIIRNSWGASWGEGGYVRLKRGDNECGISTFPVIPTVAGGILPPPPPPPPPRPAWVCPEGSTAVNTSTTASCAWNNATAKGWLMPPVVGEYCAYFDKGYFGYTFDGKLPQQAYPCPPSFEAAGDGGAAWFCTLSEQQNGFTTWPTTATPNCGNMASGMFGYSWPR